MEKTAFTEKFNFNGGENIIKSICWIFSYLLWLLLAINNLASLKWMYKEGQIWSVQVSPNSLSSLTSIINAMQNSERRLQAFDETCDENYFPIQMDYIMIYIVFNIEILISFIGCVVFFYKTLIKKEQSIIDGMMGKFSQFHFFPLLCAFILSLLGEAIKDDNGDHIANTGLAFSLIGIASMLFIYINTEFKSQDWWAEYTLKKGTFSCLLILFWYNFWYDIYWVGVAERGIHGETVTPGFTKGCGITFSMFVGIGSLAFSYVFKDIVVCFMNILIYYGMAKYYFDNIRAEQRMTKACNKNGDGAIDMIILICSIFLFLYQIIELIKEYIANYVNLENMKLKNLIVTISQAQNQTILKVNANSEQINMLSSNMNLKTKG